jgi:uncharacterized membrane protein YbhN (UPF0104 family)
MRRWQRALLDSLHRIEIVVPVLLAVALLSFAFVFGNLPAAFDRIRGIGAAAVFGGFVLALVYWVLKAILFQRLLAGIRIRPDWRRLGAAYAVGEMCLTIPAGLYAQNWVLRRMHGADMARSSAATTGVLAIESTLLMLTLVVLHIPGWPWLRPVVLALMAVLGAAFLAVMGSLGRRRPRLRRGRLRRGRLRSLSAPLFRFLRALRTLGRPLLILQAALFAAVYLTALVLAFLLVGRAVGDPGLTLVQAATIYFFSLGVSMLLGGLLSQLGVVESVGIGAAQAWGYDPTTALAMLLGFRLVWMTSIWVISGVTLWAALYLKPRAGGDVGSADDHVQKSLR